MSHMKCLFCKVSCIYLKEQKEWFTRIALNGQKSQERTFSMQTVIEIFPNIIKCWLLKSFGLMLLLTEKFVSKSVFMSLCIHWNFMKTFVSLTASVLWPFLICNIAILKKYLAASLLGHSSCWAGLAVFLVFISWIHAAIFSQCSR